MRIDLALLVASILCIGSAQAGPRYLAHGPVVTRRNVTVSYDTKYDHGSTPLSTVACSDGSYGMTTKGYTTFSSLPSFPYIGGADIIDGYDSDRCGECWRLAFDTSTGTSSINVTVIDQTENGWNIALRAMNDLTHGQGKKLGRVDAVATLVDRSDCGM
ncbi:Cerato-platanin [Dichomitus squalens]|uniref:Cerato-platanin n=1 Tax=Dichomitus squalens TaxID=114155 RepID=A0A4Q9MFC9_9APHY|nr:Cerato-platanin [Dichomitus squalens]TBU55200.1 Cerato-platanin [Dichomitus squalens]